MRPGHSLRGKMLFSSLVPMALVMAAAASLMVSGHERTARQVVESRDAALVHVSAGRVSEGLARYAALLSQYAHSHVPQGHSSLPQARVLEPSPEIEAFDGGVVHYDRQGIFVAASSGGYDRSGSVFSSDPLWQELLRTLRPVYGGVYRDALLDQEVIPIAVPLVDASEGTLEGALVGLSTMRRSLLASDLAELCSLDRSDAGHAYLVDANGKLIHHEQPSLVGSHAHLAPPAQQGLAGQNETMLVQASDGSLCLCAYAGVPNTAWTLVIEESWDEIVAPIRANTRMVVVIWVFGGIAVAAIVLYLLGRALEPIQELIEGAQRLASGDRSQRIEPCTRDEVATLAHHFNDMSDALDASFAQLEARLAQQQAIRAELEQSQAALDKSQELANTGSYVWSVKDDGLCWSRNMYAIAGLDPSDLPGTLAETVAMLLHPDDAGRVNAEIAEMIERGETWPFEFRLVRPDGAVRLLRSDSEVILDAEGEVDRVVGVHLDITEQRRAEQALQEYSVRLEQMVAERTVALSEANDQLLRQERLAALGQLAGGVAHELRNPLGAIANSVYLLRAMIGDQNPALAESVRIIARETDRANGVITSLMDYARSQTPRVEAVDLRLIVTQSLDRQPCPENVCVETTIPDGLARLKVDPRQIIMVIGNLIANAYDAMVEGGTLTLHAYGEGERVIVEVGDTGTGMPPEIVSRVFEPLFTTKSRGLGLGLPLSQDLVQSNGGTLSVTSELGVGTTFTLSLPAA